VPPAQALEAAPVREQAKSWMRPLRRWLGTPAMRLTLRFFNVLAEVITLGAKEVKDAESTRLLCAFHAFTA